MTLMRLKLGMLSTEVEQMISEITMVKRAVENCQQ